jgi:hypothetical protein
MLPAGIEHGRGVPSAPEVRENFLVEIENRLELVVTRRIVRTGSHEPIRVTERNAECA